MSSRSNEPGAEQSEDDVTPDQDPTGVEVGMSDGDGSTFEPEEDPEGHAD